jgi:hypothetical protein
MGGNQLILFYYELCCLDMQQAGYYYNVNQNNVLLEKSANKFDGCLFTALSVTIPAELTASGRVIT